MKTRSGVLFVIAALLLQSGCERPSPPATSTTNPLIGHFRLLVWLDVEEKNQEEQLVKIHSAEPFQADFWVCPGQAVRSVARSPDGRVAVLHFDRLTISES